MYENVLAVFTSDEAVTLISVEPFNCTFLHESESPFQN
ncbi:hypothetical protein N507_2339 [Lacticaseibacillus rhamnosus DSM 14870]|nr:hypothetical protein N507_2339 [Lacticaseibacillus rhamnosus DSM 14870]